MENQKEFEIIRLEKKVKTISTFKNIATVLGGIVSGTLIRNAIRNAEMHNDYGAFICSLVSLLMISGVVINIVTANDGINKMQEQIRILKRQAGINENR